MTPRHRSTVLAASLLALASLTACSGGDAGSSSTSAIGRTGAAPASPTGSATPAAPSDGTRTSATLAPAGAASAAELQESVAQLKRRAAALDLADATFEVRDGVIKGSAAGDARDKFAALAKSGRLTVRPVLAVLPSLGPGGAPAPELVQGAVPPALQQTLRTYDCTDPARATAAGATAPAEPALACSAKPEQGVRYAFALGPVALAGADLDGAKAAFDGQNGGGWQTTLAFNASGTRKFADLTGRIATEAAPGNQLAVLVDDVVVSHPFVQGAITGGQAVIAGNFTEADAKGLAAQLTGTLPVAFTLSDLTVTRPSGAGPASATPNPALTLALTATPTPSASR
ncbi:SecDF P1 head subdomain-containing protein [Kitasatospora sp. NPDC004240]